MATLEELAHIRDQALAERARVTADLDRIIQERTHLAAQIDGATLETEAIQLAALQARHTLVEREVARLTEARTQAIQAADRAQSQCANAVFDLDRAQGHLHRLLACRQDDIDVMILPIARWRELLVDNAATIRKLTGAVVELPAVPPLLELELVT